MNKTNDTPKRDQSSQPKPSSGGSPTSPGASGAGPGRGWILPLVVVLLVIAAIVLIGVAKRARTQSANQEPAPASPTESVSALASNAPPAASAPAVANSNSPPATSAPSLKLQGIVYDAVRPWAIVDGKTVYPGSRVGDYRVKEISQSTVTLEDTNGSRRTLFLGK